MDQLQSEQEKTFSDFLTMSKLLLADAQFGIMKLVLNISYMITGILIFIMSQTVDVVAVNVSLTVFLEF